MYDWIGEGLSLGSFVLSGRRWPLCVRRGGRARHLRLAVDEIAHAVVLTLPRHVNLFQAREFLRDQQEWLERKLLCVPPCVPFVRGVLLPILGRWHRVCAGKSPKALPLFPSLEHSAGTARSCYPTFFAASSGKNFSSSVQNALMALARQEAQARACGLARRLPLPAVPWVGVCDYRSFWGSCTLKDGRILLSWRLILAPLEVFQSIIAHEVVHLLYRDHSPDFWSLLCSLDPQARLHHRWLRKNGACLWRYGMRPYGIRKMAGARV